VHNNLPQKVSACQINFLVVELNFDFVNFTNNMLTEGTYNYLGTYNYDNKLYDGTVYSVGNLFYNYQYCLHFYMVDNKMAANIRFILSHATHATFPKL